MVGQMKYIKECGLCDTKIHEVVNGKLRRTGEYHEVDVTLSDLSKMTVGVCSVHTEPAREQLPLISNKVKQGWMEEVSFGIGNEEWVQSVGLKLEITGVAR